MSTAIINSELVKQERIIERGIGTFYEVGAALMAIRDDRLYRDSHKTFEVYCQERWGFSRQHASRLISAGEVARDLSPIGDKPKTESQARELAKAPPEKRAAAWEKAIDTAPKNDSGEPQVTAKHIEKAVADLTEPDDDDTESETFDYLDQQVPANLSQVFTDGEMVDEALGHLKAMLKVATALHASSAGKFLNIKQLRVAVKEAQRLLELTRPYALCPYCEGRKCSACAQVGIVPKEVHQQAQ